MNLLEISGLIIFFCLGLYLFTFGFKKYTAFGKLRKNGRVAAGEVIALKNKYLNSIPVISFFDAANDRQEGVAKNTIQIKRFNNHRPGKRLKILYDPNDPSNFVIDEPSDRIIPLLFCAVGLFFIFTILYVAIMSIILP